MTYASNPKPARNGRSSRARNGRPNSAGSIALVVWFLLAGLGLLGSLFVAAAYGRLNQGLPDPETFDDVALAQQIVVYDRTGTIELARFGDARREVVAFEDVPPLVIDAHTAIEDKTFWENSGFDPLAIIAAGIDGLRGNSRGASTITQQIVRQRLLDPDLVQDPKRTVERKLKEIIQSIRLTQAFPGEPGKQEIITAYLNQNYYGNQAYGIKAAAKSYFGKELADLTPAEAAILAGLPKSPSNYDLVRNAVEECSVPVEDPDVPCAGEVTLVVPPDSDIVKRRNQILDLLAEGDRTPLSGTQYSAADFRAAKNDPVIVAPQATPDWIAPHFVWAVQKDLTTKLCGEDVPTCREIEEGGLKVITTLDVRLQALAEKWVRTATLVPNAKNPRAAAERLGLDWDKEAWLRNLRGKDLHNGAIVALDYQTGELVAYVGSAHYYSTVSTPQFQPKFDVAGSGFRQPGSAFKPFNYLIGIDDRTMTAASMFMDVGTDFGGKYTPADADNLERGPVRVRNALQFSLNIPSVKAAAVNGVEHVFNRTRDFGMRYQTDTTNAGLSIALGVQEVKPVDLVTAYGTMANGGHYIGHTTILSVTDASGEDVIEPYVPPAGVQAASPQASWIVTDILAGNTNPKVNPYWGRFAIESASGARRPATLKTGTNNDAKDLNAYGYIAAPSAEGRAAGEYALVVGAWNGNSDNSVVSTPDRPVFSIDVTTHVWQGFLQEASREWTIRDFAQPDGLTKVAVDAWTGMRAGSGGKVVEEWFIVGTEPNAVLPAGTCGVAVLSVTGFESKSPTWMAADTNWIARAERGPGVRGGPDRNPTSYFYNRQFHPYGNSWGALVVGHGCGEPSPSPTCIPWPTPDASGVIPSLEVPSPDPSASGEVVAVPCPTEVPSESPSEEPPPTEEPSVPPSEEPSVPPSEEPSVPPSEEPSVPPSEEPPVTP